MKILQNEANTWGFTKFFLPAFTKVVAFWKIKFLTDSFEGQKLAGFFLFLFDEDYL